MMNHPVRSRSFSFISRATAALALAIWLSAGAYGQEQQGQQQEAQDSQAKPTYAPQDADKPPYSYDRPAAATPATQVQPVPGTLTVPEIGRASCRERV